MGGTPDYVLAYMRLRLRGPSMLRAILALGLHNGGIIGFVMGRHADSLASPRRAASIATPTRPCRGAMGSSWPWCYTAGRSSCGILGILDVRTRGYHVDAAIAELRLDGAVVLLLAIAALSFAIDVISRTPRQRIETLSTRLASLKAAEA